MVLFARQNYTEDKLVQETYPKKGTQTRYRHKEKTLPRKFLLGGARGYFKDN